MENLLSLKSQCEEFEVEFEVVSPQGLDRPQDERQKNINHELSLLDRQLAANQAQLDALNTEIDRLTSHADGIDYAIAVTCGIVTGMIDSLLVGEWDFKKAKAVSNEEINKRVIEFAKKDPQYADFVARKRSTDQKDVNRLENAVAFLEGKYKLPGDGDYQNFKNLGMEDATHHLDDLCHHPTFVGLICCIIVQFTGSTTYYPSTGTPIQNVPVTVNEYGKFVGHDTWPKVFAGIINWFFNAAETIRNRKGHLMSDMAGSSKAISHGSGGAGLPGSFLSILKELSVLPCFQDSNFAENLRKAYRNGIGTGEKQVDLGVFNSLFADASSKFDLRTEMAIGHELKRQALPVVLNEIFVRGLYFVRRFIAQMREHDSVLELDWRAMLPAGNRTIVRMMTVASGTFTAVDMADAAIRSAIKSGGVNAPAFAANMVLRVNFVGVGRFAIAVGTDTVMGVKRTRARNERIRLYEEQLALTGAKVFYKEADMWIAAENAGETIQQAWNMMEKTTAYWLKSMEEINDSLNQIGRYVPEIQKKNPGLLEEIDDILTWG